MIKIAVVGTGMIAKDSLAVIVDYPQIQVDMICSTKRSVEQGRAIAAQYKIPNVYDDYRIMLSECKEKGIDVVYIATPNALHYDMTKEALEAGLHVFLEKPFTTKMCQTEELIALAREKRLYLVEAISNQYLPIYGEMKKLLPKLGTITYVDCNFSQYSSRFKRFLDGEVLHTFDPENGGTLMDLNVYNLHVMAGLFGLPQEMEYHPNINRDVDTSGVVVMKYPGFTATLAAAKDSHGPSHVLVEGTKGYMMVNAPSNSLAAPLIYYSVEEKTESVVFTPDDSHRLADEFIALEEMICKDDYESCLARQEETILVMKMLSWIREK